MNKLSLNSVEWKSFRLSDIFSTLRGKRHIKKNRLQGNLPYVSASSLNNGVTDFISNPLFTSKNKLVVTTFCDAYYMENEFTASDEMVLLSHKKLNKYSGLFIAQVIKSNKNKYAFDKKAFSKRLKEQMILLPIDEKGEPNWDFMENYIKQIMNRQKSQIINYYKSQICDITYGGGLKHKDIKWKSFKIYDVFQTFTNKNKLQTPTGYYINKVLLEKSDTPRITVRGTNNGVDSFSDTKIKKIVFFENFISVSFLGTVFYHPYKASIDMKVHALIPLNTKLNKYIASFLIPIIKDNISFSSYGDQLSSTDLAQLTLILPIDEKGEPNWKYMENYVKQKLHSQAKQIINYYES